MHGLHSAAAGEKDRQVSALSVPGMSKATGRVFGMACQSSLFDFASLDKPGCSLGQQDKMEIRFIQSFRKAQDGLNMENSNLSDVCTEQGKAYSGNKLRLSSSREIYTKTP